MNCRYISWKKLVVESQKAAMQESKELEAECEKIIEKAQSVIVKWAAESSVVSPPIEQNTTNLVDKTDTVVTNNQGSSKLLSLGLVSTLVYPMI